MAARHLLPLRLVTGAFFLHHGAWVLVADPERWGRILTAMGAGEAALPWIVALEATVGLALLVGAPVRTSGVVVLPWLVSWTVLGYFRLAGPTGWLTPAALTGVVATLVLAGGGPPLTRLRALAAWDDAMIGGKLTGAKAYASWPLRLGVATVMTHQGLDKLVRLDEWVGIFTDLGLPAPELTAPLVAFAEVAGSAALVAGVLVRFTVATWSLILVVAIATAWWPLPPGTGWDLDVLLLAAFATFLAGGAGRPNLASMFGARFRDPEERAWSWWRGRSAA